MILPQQPGRAAQQHITLPVPPASQLLVERYFLTTGVLSSFYYWIGAKRVSASPAVFYNTSNTEVPEAYSTEPYAHWASYHYQQASAPGYECVLAVGSYAYDTFTGNPESKAHLGNSTLYQRTNDNKYGWVFCLVSIIHAPPLVASCLDSSPAQPCSTLIPPSLQLGLCHLHRQIPRPVRHANGRLPLLPTAAAASTPAAAALATAAATAPELRSSAQRHLLLLGHQLLPAGPRAAVRGGGCSLRLSGTWR
jgi:hypothetical protein